MELGLWDGLASQSVSPQQHTTHWGARTEMPKNKGHLIQTTLAAELSGVLLLFVFLKNKWRFHCVPLIVLEPLGSSKTFLSACEARRAGVHGKLTNRSPGSCP